MSKFKMPSPESFRENIELAGLTERERKDALEVLDYCSAHPLSLEEKREQARRGKPGSNVTEKKNS